MDILGWLLALGGTLVGGLILLFVEYGYFQKKKLREQSQVTKDGGRDDSGSVIDRPRPAPKGASEGRKTPAALPDINISSGIQVSIANRGGKRLTVEVTNNTPRALSCDMYLDRLERWSPNQHRLVRDVSLIQRTYLLGSNFINPDDTGNYYLCFLDAESSQPYILCSTTEGHNKWPLERGKTFCAFLEITAAGITHHRQIFFSVGPSGALEVCPDPRQ
jgi:hypothetical protein